MDAISQKSEIQNGSAKADGDFQDIIESSKQNIAAMAPAAPKIRPKGKGSRGPYKKTRLKMEGQDHAEAPDISPAPPAPMVDISRYLSTPLMMISKIPAQKTGIPQLALSPDEAAACAQSLNECLQAFAPSMGEMSPTTAAVLGACMVFGSIGFEKYQIYQFEMEKRTPKIQPEVQNKTEKVPGSPNETLPAGSYFASSGV